MDSLAVSLRQSTVVILEVYTPGVVCMCFGYRQGNEWMDGWIEGWIGK